MNRKLAIIADQIGDDLETALSIMQQKGYHNVELHNVFGKTIEALRDAEVWKIKALLERYDMNVVNIASTIFFMCPLYDDYKISLFKPSFKVVEGDVKTHLDYLEKACKIAEILNCKTIRVFPFRQPDNVEKKIVGTKEHQEKIIEYLKQAVDVVKRYDKTIVLENCPYSHTPKGQMTYEMACAINDEHLRLLWDPGNSYRAMKERVPKEYLDLDLREEYRLIQDKIGYVHVKNYHKDNEKFIHTALDAGDIDYDALLKNMNGDYVFSLEPELEYNQVLHDMDVLQTIGKGNE